MSRTRKRTINAKIIAIMLALLIIISIGGSLLSEVFAVGSNAIQFNGITTIESEYAVFKEGTTVVGRLIGKTTGATNFSSSNLSGNSYEFRELNEGNYVFEVEVTEGYSLSVQKNGGTSVDTTLKEETSNIYEFTVASAEAGTLSVNLVFTPIEIRFTGMDSTAVDGHAIYKVSGVQAAKIKGITEGAISFSDATYNDGSSTNEFVFSGLASNEYRFVVDLEDGYELISANVGGNNLEIMTSSVDGYDVEFNVNVANNTSNIVELVFEAENSGGEQPPLTPQQPPLTPQQPSSNIKIYLGESEIPVIDETANITSYNDDNIKISQGSAHLNYVIEFKEGASSIGAIGVEGNGYLGIIPEFAKIDEEVVPQSIINANSNGYSIYSVEESSAISVEMCEGGGSGTLLLKGGISINGNLTVSDHSMQIGTDSERSVKGIKAQSIFVSYTDLIIYTTGELLTGNSLQNKMNINVINNANLIANTTYTGTALTNVGDAIVRSGGRINISTSGTLGELVPKVQYYGFADFEATDEVTEEDVLETLVAVVGNTEKYEMTKDTNSIDLKSLSKCMFIIAYNMTDADGKIIEDTKVENGIVKIITAYGIGAGATGTGSGYFQIEAGTEVKIELLPNYGYQFKSASINGTVVEAEGEVATYTFTMPNNQLHLSALFEKAEDKIVIETDGIVDASIDNLDGQINGNAEFTIEDATDVDEDAFEEAADGATIVGYADLSLTEVILKGSGTDAWTTPITDLTEEMEVTIKVSDEIAETLPDGANVTILRDHNNEITELEATYNKDTKELVFETDGYSTYAIIYNLVDGNTGASNTVKTGDTVVIIAVSVIVLIVIANVIIIKQRKNK